MAPTDTRRPATRGELTRRLARATAGMGGITYLLGSAVRRATGTATTYVGGRRTRIGKYQLHQGARETARRVRRMSGRELSAREQE